MIGVSISAIIVLMVLNTIDNQNKALRQFELKSDLIEQKNFLQGILGSESVCNWQFTALGQTLNTTALNPDGTLVSQLNFTRVYSGLDNTSKVLAEVNQEFAGTKLIVKDIKYVNIRPTGATDLYMGELNISFHQIAGMAAIKPVSVVKTI